MHENDGTAVLATFIERYMALAPDFVTAFNDFLNSANISGEIARQVITARDFIEVPVGIVSSEEGLEAQIYHDKFGLQALLHWKQSPLGPQ